MDYQDPHLLLLDRPRVRRAERYLHQLAGQHRPLLGGVVLLRLLIGTATIGLLWAIAELVGETVVGGKPLLVGSTLFRTAAGALLTRSVAGPLADWAGSRLAGRIADSVRLTVVDRLAAGGWPLIRQRGAGYWSSLWGESIDAFEPYYAYVLPQAWATGLLSVGLLVGISALNWVCSSLLLLTLPLIGLFAAVAGQGAVAAGQAGQRALTELGGYFWDRLRGLTTLVLLGQADAEAGRVGLATDAYHERIMTLSRLTFLSSAVLEFFSAVATAGVAIYISLSLLGYLPAVPYTMPLTLERGLLILLWTGELYAGLRGLAGRYHERVAAIATAMELESERLQIVASPAVRLPRTLTTPPAVEWVDLVVAGESGRRSVQLGSGWVAPGEIVCVEGISGRGKSQLLAALLGFSTVESGVIRVNGQAITPSLTDWQAGCAWVGQAPYLRGGTLRDNLLSPTEARLSKTESDYALKNALDAVGADGLVARLPHGLDTPIGDNGGRLSGGERQQVALARALLRRPQLLLLDEPATHLDRRAVARLTQTLRELAGHCTVILTGHPDDWPPFRTLTLPNYAPVSAVIPNAAT